MNQFKASLVEMWERQLQQMGKLSCWPQMPSDDVLSLWVVEDAGLLC